MQNIRSAGSGWSGDSYLAAYDRIAGDRDLGVRAAGAVDGLAQQLIDGGGSLTSYRQVLLRRVDDAVGAGAIVSEDWSVTGAELSAEELEFHRSGISTGLAELLTARSATSAGASTIVSEIQMQAATLSVTDAGSDSSALMNGQSVNSDTLAAGSPGATTPSAGQGTPANLQTLATTQQSGNTAGTPVLSGTPISADGSGNSAKPTDTGGGSSKPTDTGGGSGTGGKSSSGGSTSSAFDPSKWTTSDLVSVLGAVKGFTGDLPSLINSLSGLDNDLDDIIKASADAAVKLGFGADDADSGSAAETGAGDKPSGDKPSAAKPVSDVQATDTPGRGAAGSEGNGSQIGAASPEPGHNAAQGGTSQTNMDNGTKITPQSVSGDSSQTATAATSSLVGLPPIGRRSEDDSRRIAPSAVVPLGSDENSPFTDDEFWASAR
ncbi:hypothetical protein ACTWPB_08830 [Nocardia sp. IBHARD005]|uniref:hypothetical protein n=1 Tax=Nocardia sp. IBHARD005 TaxID=3457765 RepID=UPI004058873D